MTSRSSILAIMALLLVEPALARPVDVDPGAYRPRHHYRHHRARHTPRVRTIPDPPGVKWIELPEAPEVPEGPKAHFVLVRTVAFPPTEPLFQTRYLLPPSLPAITPAIARAYCITHRLECAPPQHLEPSQ